MPDALIWGASGGIGSRLVEQLKAEGWRVFAAARHKENIPATADFKFHFEADDENTVKEVAIVLAHETQGLDLAIYAAGGIHAETVQDIGPQAWQDVYAANLYGAYLTTQNTLHLIKEGGHVMFLGAYVDNIMLPKFGAYATAKAGLEPLVAVLRKEHRRINFSLVRPPAVDTPFWDHVPFSLPRGALSASAVAQAMLQQYAAGRGGNLDL